MNEIKNEPTKQVIKKYFNEPVGRFEFSFKYKINNIIGIIMKKTSHIIFLVDFC